MLVFEVYETGPYSLVATRVAGVPYRKESCREKKKLGGQNGIGIGQHPSNL